MGDTHPWLSSFPFFKFHNSLPNSEYAPCCLIHWPWLNLRSLVSFSKTINFRQKWIIFITMFLVRQWLVTRTFWITSTASLTLVCWLSSCNFWWCKIHVLQQLRIQSYSNGTSRSLLNPIKQLILSCSHLWNFPPNGTSRSDSGDRNWLICQSKSARSSKLAN